MKERRKEKEERRAERRARREEKEDAWLAANPGMRKYLPSRLVHKYQARRAVVDGQIKPVLINIKDCGAGMHQSAHGTTTSCELRVRSWGRG